MTNIQSLLICVDRFRVASNLAEATLSTRLLGSGSRLGSLRAGESDIGVRRLAKAMQWLSDHWPEGADWPDAVERPAPSLQPSPSSALEPEAQP